MKRSVAILGAVLLMAACASTGTTATPTPLASATASPQVAATASPVATATIGPSPTNASATPTILAPRCPNPEGGLGNTCLGPLPAGMFHTTTFHPTLTYTVPAGWGNDEDLPGNFLLLSVDATLVGVNAGTSDYLGVYSSVVAAGHCTGEPSTTVPHTWQGLVDWLSSDPALTVTNRKPVTVSGLSGDVMDVAAKGPSGDGCSDGYYADVYVGAGDSSLVHSVMTNYRMRIYLLRHGTETLAIEIADAPDGYYADWPTTAAGVVATFRFTP